MSWRPLGASTAQETPKTAQEAPKTAREVRKTVPNAPKTAQKAPKRRPRGSQDGPERILGQLPWDSMANQPFFLGVLGVWGRILGHLPWDSMANRPTPHRPPNRVVFHPADQKDLTQMKRNAVFFIFVRGGSCSYFRFVQNPEVSGGAVLGALAFCVESWVSGGAVLGALALGAKS